MAKDLRVKKKVLVVGFTTRHVACSAHNAGYSVYAVDNFCDKDLKDIVVACRTFDDLSELVGIIDEFDREENFDIIVSTSGAEDLTLKKKISGTDSKTASFFLDKKNIQNFFESNNIPAPKIRQPGMYPAFIKPCVGAGGWRNKKVDNFLEEKEWTDLWPDVPYVRQEVAEGIPCSVSCISNGKRAVAVSFNEQFLRGGNKDKSYGFSGAITPFTHPMEKEIVKTAEKIVSLSGCIGSVGVDFIAGEDSFYAIEINPRFQATMDIVEKSYGINLFNAHMSACTGLLPHPDIRRAKQYTARKVLFAPKDIVVKDDLSVFSPDIADIPLIGTEIEEGCAVVSIYGFGSTRSDALESLDKTIKDIGRYISRW
ncbi:MAG: ATP-grasp domain-containing protein [Methanomicrobium sp.]|nr:ATP-grasp domain-containing protein [Methanomicrobium sp.]